MIYKRPIQINAQYWGKNSYNCLGSSKHPVKLSANLSKKKRWMYFINKRPGPTKRPVRTSTHRKTLFLNTRSGRVNYIKLY